MNRRDLLTSCLGLGALALRPGRVGAQEQAPPGWRSFTVTTKLALRSKGETTAWVPVPGTVDASWARADAPAISSNGTARLQRDAASGATFVVATWPADVVGPELTVTSIVTTRDRQVSPDQPRTAMPLTTDERAFFTRATDLIPTDGIVRDTVETIVDGATTDLAKARAIYEWVVDNTFRDPKTRGCGTGDVASMLKSGNLGGKCADINALTVGLARSAGLPARDVYGIRVAPSRRGFKSLGASSEVISKSQHCRAEIFVDGSGWIPVDPADVRKVALEEPPGNLPLASEPVRRARAMLFGGWEMNWVPYNTAHDLDLPGPVGLKVPFLMYPTGLTGGTALDSLDPDGFGYTITSRELVS